jgi:GTP-binding protein Era
MVKEVFKSGFVALAGLPNVGKSTLMNALLGQKISIATSKPQTTRNRILGVQTHPERGQVIYVDTPGIHRPHKALNSIMVDNALSSIGGTDLVLFIVDAAAAHSKGPIFKGDRHVARALAATKLPIIIAINKIDRLPTADHALPLIEAYEGLEGLDPIAVVTISALKSQGLDALETLLFEHLPEGPQLYPEDMITDQAERFIAAEFVREKLTLQTRKEIPYSSAVVVEEFHEDLSRGLLRMRAIIYVEQESQKGIVIGKGGSRLKQIGSQARAELEKFFGRKVFLEMHVKVARGWATDIKSLERLGYVREE